METILEKLRDLSQLLGGSDDIFSSQMKRQDWCRQTLVTTFRKKRISK
jgi:hypothetical protein